MSADPVTHPPLVLVVDDEVPIRRFLRAALEGSGYRLSEAASGEEALREAAMRSPDAIGAPSSVHAASNSAAAIANGVGARIRWTA